MELVLAPWFQNDSRLPQTRLAFASYFIVFMIGLLLLGFWKLQIVNSDRYSQLAERNRVRTIPIIAPRGTMLDREGRVLVDNYPSFSVLLLRDDPEVLSQLLPQIADGLGLAVDDIKQQVEAAKALPHFQPIVIKPEAVPATSPSSNRTARIFPCSKCSWCIAAATRATDSWRTPADTWARSAPNRSKIATGAISPATSSARAGLEKQYNEQLMGMDGQRRVIVNSVGREVGRLEQTDAMPGKPIRLTIDYDLQAVAEQDLAGKKGAVVAIDPNTGEILAMASQPSYDPNDFAIRVSREEWQRLNEDPDHPLMDRTIQAQLAPGSIFKMSDDHGDAGVQSRPRRLSRCSVPAMPNSMAASSMTGRKRGHGDDGSAQRHRALVRRLLLQRRPSDGDRPHLLLRDASSDWAARPAWTCRAKIPASCPRKNGKSVCFTRSGIAGETISVAIGQGATVVTPMQLAYTYRRHRDGRQISPAALLDERSARAGSGFPDLRIHCRFRHAGHVGRGE